MKAKVLRNLNTTHSFAYALGLDYGLSNRILNIKKFYAVE